MDKKTSLKYELISAWCGPLFLITFIVCFMILGTNLPAPPSPALGPDAMKAHIVENLSQLRLGWVLCLIFVALYMPWTAQISTQMSRIEKHSRTMTYLQLIGGTLTVFVVSFSILCWAIATFRPERSPEIMQLLMDFGWESLELQYALTIMQMVALALVGLADKSDNPVFPRWACYLSLWCAISFFPASLTQYMKTGPFAWGGLLSFYIPYAAWLIWCGVTSHFMIRDIKNRMASISA